MIRPRSAVARSRELTASPADRLLNSSAPPGLFDHTKWFAPRPTKPADAPRPTKPADAPASWRPPPGLLPRSPGKPSPHGRATDSPAESLSSVASSGSHAAAGNRDEQWQLMIPPGQGGGMKLRRACKEGDVMEIKRLLQAGASVFSYDEAFERTALHYAAQHGHADCCAILVQCGASVASIGSQRLLQLTGSRVGHARPPARDARGGKPMRQHVRRDVYAHGLHRDHHLRRSSGKVAPGTPTRTALHPTHQPCLPTRRRSE